MSFDGKGKARLDNHVAVFCEGAWTHSRSVASKTVSVEYRNRWPGAMLGGMNLVAEEWAERFHSAGTPTQENRWSTESVSLWRNAQADAIMDELNSIIPEDRAMELQVEFVKLYTRDCRFITLRRSL